MKSMERIVPNLHMGYTMRSMHSCKCTEAHWNDEKRDTVRAHSPLETKYSDEFFVAQTNCLTLLYPSNGAFRGFQIAFIALTRHKPFSFDSIDSAFPPLERSSRTEPSP